MRPARILLFLCVAAIPALAGTPGTNVEMPYLMAPMTGSDGTLAGYAYISSRLAATSTAVALEVRDRIAFIQDAFVQDVNRATIAKPGDPATVDKDALALRLLADARRVMGPGKVAGIAIVELQIAPLRAAPTTQGAAQPPDPAAKTP